jgi:hypothetical protein
MYPRLLITKYCIAVKWGFINQKFGFGAQVHVRQIEGPRVEGEAGHEGCLSCKSAPKTIEGQ